MSGTLFEVEVAIGTSVHSMTIGSLSETQSRRGFLEFGLLDLLAGYGRGGDGKGIGD